MYCLQHKACRKPASGWLRRINKIIFVVAPPPEMSFDLTACGKPWTLAVIFFRHPMYLVNPYHLDINKHDLALRSFLVHLFSDTFFVTTLCQSSDAGLHNFQGGHYCDLQLNS